MQFYESKWYEVKFIYLRDNLFADNVLINVFLTKYFDFFKNIFWQIKDITHWNFPPAGRLLLLPGHITSRQPTFP